MARAPSDAPSPEGPPSRGGRARVRGRARSMRRAISRVARAAAGRARGVWRRCGMLRAHSSFAAVLERLFSPQLQTDDLAEQFTISHLHPGHGGVWRVPCSSRLLAGCSLSSATLSWSDDDVYR